MYAAELAAVATACNKMILMFATCAYCAVAQHTKRKIIIEIENIK